MEDFIIRLIRFYFIRFSLLFNFRNYTLNAAFFYPCPRHLLV